MTNLRKMTTTIHGSRPGAAPRRGIGWAFSLPALALTLLGGCEGELDLTSFVVDAGSQADGSASQDPDGGGPAQDVDAGGQVDAAGEGAQHEDGQAGEQDAGTQKPADDAGAGEDAGDAQDDASQGTDSDPADDAGDEEDASDTPEPEDDGERMPVIVVAGANHQLALSIDDGVTWCLSNEDPSLTGFDNPHLLRNVTYANGYFVAGSWEGLYRSRNGYEWEDVLEQSDTPDRPAFGQWIAQVDYGNGWWVATGGAGTAMRSKDMLQWEVTGLPGGNAARSLAFGNGKFVTGRDGDTWWESTDGASWTQTGTGNPQLIFDGANFRDNPGYDCALDHPTCMQPRWGQSFMRSADGGASWTPTAVTLPNNVTRFAFGEAPVADFEAGADMPPAVRSCLGL